MRVSLRVASGSVHQFQKTQPVVPADGNRRGPLLLNDEVPSLLGPAMTTLLLIRHAESLASADKLLAGRVPSFLANRRDPCPRQKLERVLLVTQALTLRLSRA